MVTFILRPTLNIRQNIACKFLIQPKGDEMLLYNLIIRKIKKYQEQKPKLDRLCFCSKHYKRIRKC